MAGATQPHQAQRRHHRSQDQSLCDRLATRHGATRPAGRAGPQGSRARGNSRPALRECPGPDQRRPVMENEDEIVPRDDSPWSEFERASNRGLALVVGLALLIGILVILITITA